MKPSLWSYLLLAIGTACLMLALAADMLPIEIDPRMRGKLIGLGLGLLFAGGWRWLMPRWWRTQCDEEFDSAAGRRYRRTVIPAMCIYVLLLMLSTALLQRGITWLPVRALVALLPALPIALVLHAFLGYLRRVDEFQRRIELEAIGVGALMVSLLYVSAAFLQFGKVIDMPAGMAMIWVFPSMCLGYGIGKFLAHRRYR